MLSVDLYELSPVGQPGLLDMLSVLELRLSNSLSRMLRRTGSGRGEFPGRSAILVLDRRLAAACQWQCVRHAKTRVDAVWKKRTSEKWKQFFHSLLIPKQMLGVPKILYWHQREEVNVLAWEWPCSPCNVNDDFLYHFVYRFPFLAVRFWKESRMSKTWTFSCLRRILKYWKRKKRICIRICFLHLSDYLRSSGSSSVCSCEKFWSFLLVKKVPWNEWIKSFQH